MRWSDAEDAELKTRWKAGQPVKSIGVDMGRSKGAVCARVHFLNLPTRNGGARDGRSVARAYAPPSQAMVALAAFDPVIARALHQRLAEASA